MVMTLVGLPIYVSGALLLIGYALETHAEDRGGFETKLYSGITLGDAISSIVGIPVLISDSRKIKDEVALKEYNIKSDNSIAFGLGLLGAFCYLFIEQIHS